jgi:hypothetical protein
MTDADTYALDAIRKWVWSGFYSREDVKRMLQDIVEPGQDVDALLPSIEETFQKKERDERSKRLTTTDCIGSFISCTKRASAPYTMRAMTCRMVTRRSVRLSLPLQKTITRGIASITGKTSRELSTRMD